MTTESLSGAELEARIARYKAIPIPNPTLAELEALIARGKALTTDPVIDEALSVPQFDSLCNELNDAIFAARPTEPAALARLLRFTLENSLSDIDEIDAEILEHVASSCEAMAAPPTG